MPLKSPLVFGLLMAIAGAWAVFAPKEAEDPPHCITDRRGDYKCAQPGGDVILGVFGHATCGPGPCVLDGGGRVFCAREPDQSAVVRPDGIAECTSGCIRASADFCMKLKE